jgi:hypothetical protein
LARARGTYGWGVAKSRIGLVQFQAKRQLVSFRQNAQPILVPADDREAESRDL